MSFKQNSGVKVGGEGGNSKKLTARKENDNNEKGSCC